MRSPVKETTKTRSKTRPTLDGNEAVARVVYLLKELIAIYPITDSFLIEE